MRGGFTSQMKLPQTLGEAPHQRLDLVELLGSIELTKVGGSQGFLAACAVSGGARVVIAGDPPAGHGGSTETSSVARHTARITHAGGLILRSENICLLGGKK